MKIAGGLVVSLLCATPGWAAGPPPKAIWGKSFVVASIEDRHQRVLPDGEWIDRRVARTTELYISSAGRVFKRERVVRYSGADTAGRGRSRRAGSGADTGSNERVIGEGEGQLHVDASFKGNTILITTLAAQGPGAKQMAVRFDEAVRSCEASILQGKADGASSYIIKSLVNGRSVEIQSARSADVSCSVVDGNVFDN